LKPAIWGGALWHRGWHGDVESDGKLRVFAAGSAPTLSA
jgi:hypothetical protein